MWPLITHHEVPPPNPEPVDDEDIERGRFEPGAYGAGKTAVVPAPRPSLFAPPGGPVLPGTKRKWTYGKYLLRNDIALFSAMDLDLRALVARCLMDEPRDRPEMDEIRAIIDAKLASDWNAAEDDQTMREGPEARALFADPPAPRVHLQSDLRSVSDPFVFSFVRFEKATSAWHG